MFRAAADVLGVSPVRPRRGSTASRAPCRKIGIKLRNCFWSAAFSCGSERKPAQRCRRVRSTSGIIALEEEVVRVAIRVRVHQDRAAGISVAPGAADFLVIRFQAARQGRVDHGADVGFINSHTKRDGRDHDLEPALAENAPAPAGGARIQPGVIGGGGKIAAEFSCQAVGLLSRWRVNDGGSALRIEQQFARRARLVATGAISTTSIAMLSRRKP